MNISVVVTCFNEEININECLNSLCWQSYPASQYEIVVVDGDSKDNTVAIVKDFAKIYSNIRLVIEPKKGTAAGRNAGIKASCYDYIAFIDADCMAPVEWLSLLAERYKQATKNDKNIIAVGGANRVPQEANKFLKAMGIVLDSYLGSFNSIQGRQFKSPVFVPSLSTSNALYDKNKIIEIGYFDESLQSEAEDADLNYRLTSKGNKFLYIPDSFVWHKMRLTPTAWFKNMFRYGKGRARLLKRYPQMWTFPYLLPILFILMFMTVMLMPFSRIAFLFSFYFIGLFIFSLFQCLKKKSVFLTFHAMFIYLIQHFGYATGEIYGLFNTKVK